MGHTVRSCVIGMRVASAIGLPADQQSALFYALLLKDAGCSSNAAKMCSLFGADDRWLKRETKTIDWSRLSHSLIYVACHAVPHGSVLERAMRVLGIAFRGPRSARRLVETRCERGAVIARMLEFSNDTAEAIRALDEHWDGSGHPRGLRGQEIPLLGRIMGLAQTMEVFFSTSGLDTACEVARTRKRRWFDPQLVEAFLSIRKDEAFWRRLADGEIQEQVAALEPEDRVLFVDDARLDRVAEAFAKVIDAKSPWTYNHSEGVAELAVGIGTLMGFSPQTLRDLRRAALLHDIGKLGVSNLILDKPGRLTPDERAEMCRHTGHTQNILGRVKHFEGIAHLASSHHERLDGKGYHRGLSGPELSPAARVLPAADIYEALTAHRPYRPALSPDRVLDMMRADLGTALCPQAFMALERHLEQRGTLATPPLQKAA
jgi:HD-GYP domain-containing protein (c-di-GMP phosphodiesterase class II)